MSEKEEGGEVCGWLPHLQLRYGRGTPEAFYPDMMTHGFFFEGVAAIIMAKQFGGISGI